MHDVTNETGPTDEFQRATGTTLHICAREHWMGQRHLYEYEPEQFAIDGFVHCTDDCFRLMEIANTYYQQDLRPYVAIEIDLDALRALAIYEDEAYEFPHIYGRVPLSCVRRVIPVEREEDGTFLRFANEVQWTSH